MMNKQERVITVGRYPRISCDYQRAVPLANITYDCILCSEPQQHTQYPGQKPRYCPDCRQVAKRARARLRQAKRRRGLCKSQFTEAG